MTKKLVCIECPRGCELSAEIAGGKVESIAGNFCVRGKSYAQSECVNPTRVLTTTIRLKSGKMLPVKTDQAVQKASLKELITKINQITAREPIAIGQILAKDIDGNGANLISTKIMPKFA